MNKNVKKIMLAILFVIPGVLGTMGYLSVGYKFTDSLYGAISLYFLSLCFDECPILVELARWTAPIATASGILFAIRGIVERMKNTVLAKLSHTTIIYSDKDNVSAKQFAKDCPSGFWGDYSENELNFYPNTDDQIIMFKRDKDSLAFYEKHKEQLSKKRVYMKLDETNPYLLKSSNIHFFNTNEMIAEAYWKKNHLIPYLRGIANGDEVDHGVCDMRLDIALIGTDRIMQSLLNNALLLNLYSPHQKITYHVFGMNKDYINLHQSFDIMNDDQIIYYQEPWTERLDMISACQRIIMLTPTNHNLEEVMFTAPGAEIHVFSRIYQGYEMVYRFDKLKEFGNMQEVYTEERIKKEKNLDFAKKLNFHYACLYGDSASDAESEWMKLDGFTKASNTTATNYHEIRCLIRALREEQGIEISQDEYARMEHIRWCRFHFLNRWKYGVPENGKNKDTAKHIHVCLCPYDELTELDQSKDWESVQLLFSLQS